MRVWKLLGLAGILAGVATGAAVARDERVRRHYDAGEIRDRLHARHDEAVARESSEDSADRVLSRVSPAGGSPARRARRAR